MTMTTFPNSKRSTIVGCGFIAWDVVLGENLAVAYTGVGGTVGNVISIMSFLGWQTVPIVRLGDDSAGTSVLNELVALDVDVQNIAIDCTVTTPVVYQYNKDNVGDHAFTFKCPYCGKSRHYCDDSLSDLDAPAGLPAGHGDVFFFDRLTENTVSLAEQAMANGALTVFEPSGPGNDSTLFFRALRAAKVVKYSAERLDPSALPLMGSEFIEIQTLGAAGLRFRMRSSDPTWVSIPAFHLNSLKDTAGAGDWCTAGFLHFLNKKLQDRTLLSLKYDHVYAALRGGQFLSALNCQHLGARGLMRHGESARIRDVVFRLENDGTPTVWGDSFFNWSEPVARQTYHSTLSDATGCCKYAMNKLQCC